MENRYPVTPEPEHCLEACHNDNELQALDGNSIKQSIRDAAPDNLPTAAPLSSDKQTEPEVPLVRKLPLPNLEIRLQQAARILVNAAIRAAMTERRKHSEKPAQKGTKTRPRTDVRFLDIT